MFENIYTETYKRLIQDEKKRYKVVLRDDPEKVLGEFSNGVSAYYFCQDYTKQNLGVPVNQVEISADGSERILNTFIGSINARQNFHMSDYNAYSRRLFNKARYQAIAAANAEKRQAKFDLREKIRTIRETAEEKIAELNAEIERIRLEANNQILKLKGGKVQQTAIANNPEGIENNINPNDIANDTEGLEDQPNTLNLESANIIYPDGPRLEFNVDNMYMRMKNKNAMLVGITTEKLINGYLTIGQIFSLGLDGLMKGQKWEPELLNLVVSEKITAEDKEKIIETFEEIRKLFKDKQSFNDNIVKINNLYCDINDIFKNVEIYEQEVLSNKE